MSIEFLSGLALGIIIGIALDFVMLWLLEEQDD